MNAGFLARGTGCLTVPGLGTEKGKQARRGEGENDAGLRGVPGRGDAECRGGLEVEPFAVGDTRGREVRSLRRDAARVEKRADHADLGQEAEEPAIKPDSGRAGAVLGKPGEGSREEEAGRVKLGCPRGASK